jgi:hypothetical protein
MSNDLTHTAEKLMVMRLCGIVINAHWEHLKSFQDAFELPPDLQTTRDNAEAMQLMEDAIAATTEISPPWSEVARDVTRVMGYIEASIPGIAQMDSEACAIAGVLARDLSKQVLLTEMQRSVVDRCLALFKKHRKGDLLFRADIVDTAADVKVSLQEIGLFQEERNATCVSG